MQGFLSKLVTGAIFLLLLSFGTTFGQDREFVEVTSTLSQPPGVFEEPNFMPKEEWGRRYADLFKQAIKSKYGVDDKTLDRILIVGVVRGTKSDGFITPFIKTPEGEKRGRVSYLYKAGWAYYRGDTVFDVEDKLGNELSDQEILRNISNKLIPIFTISDIISKEKAINSCDPPAEFPPLEGPWYSGDNRILFDERNELVFTCHKAVSQEENRCLTETFSLETGERLDSRESACIVYGTEGVSSGDGGTSFIKNLFLFVKSIFMRLVNSFYSLFSSSASL